MDVPANQDEIILKTNYVEKHDIRRVRIKRTEFSLTQLRSLLHKLYAFADEADYLIKYQDDEGDMITISHDLELQEAFRWITSVNQKCKGPQMQALHLIIIFDSKTNSSKPKALIGITDLFIKQFQNLSVKDQTEEKKNEQVVQDPPVEDKTIPKSAIDFDHEDLTKYMAQLSLKNIGILPGTEWHGLMTYPDETYPFMLTVTSFTKKKMEGTIMWPTLNAVTVWLGNIRKDGQKLVFTEYEALLGAENIELPNNYSCELCGNLLSGHIITKDGTDPTFVLKFAGISSREDGFLQSLSAQENGTKRKYNLISNSAADVTTFQDKWASFKKLTQNSASWYQKVGDTPFVSEPRKKSEIRKSCGVCREPLFEQLDKQGKKIVACPRYPNCYTPKGDDEHYDSSEEEEHGDRKSVV